MPKNTDGNKNPPKGLRLAVIGAAAVAAAGILCTVLVIASGPKDKPGGGGGSPALTASQTTTRASAASTAPGKQTAAAPSGKASPAPASAGGTKGKTQEPAASPSAGAFTATIAFTFDDGYVSDYNCAYATLKQYGIRGTSYIIGKLPDNNTPNALSWAQIKEMAAYGWDFGCHTYNHVDMTKLSNDAIKKSLEEENASFEKQGLPDPKIIAYPSGKYDQRVINAVKPFRVQGRKAFYESKFVDLKHVNPYEIDSISADMDGHARLQTREKLVDKACSEHAVIVFRTHCMYFQKRNDNGHWDVQTDSRLFAELVKYCVNKGCRFVTMTDLMKLYS